MCFLDVFAAVALLALSAAQVVSLQGDALDLIGQLPVSTRHFRQMFSAAASDPSGWWQHLTVLARSAGADGSGTSATMAAAVNAEGIEATLIKGSLGAVMFLGQVVIVLFLVFFLLVVKLPATTRSGIVTGEILTAIGTRVQRFIGVLAITNLTLGLLTWVTFSLLGLAHAGLWGLLAGLLHFVPYAGPAVIVAASAVAASVQFESLSRGLLIGAVSLGLAALVGLVPTTMLTGRAVRMNAATMFVGLLFWAWLWGLPGLLLGAPMMLTMKVIADRLPGLDWLSRFLGHAGVDRDSSHEGTDPPMQWHAAVARGLPASHPWSKLGQWLGARGFTMDQHPDSVRALAGKPSAFLPMLMSLAALAVVLGSLVASSGVVRERDEGASAHIWQLLMTGQLPILAYFVIRWLPRAPRPALRVLSLQIALALAALVPVYVLGL